MMDRQLIAACRNLLHEYEPVLIRIQEELEREDASTPLGTKSLEDVAIKAIRRDALKDGMTALIGRIKHYGSQRPE
jgi:hypothetical protein